MTALKCFRATGAPFQREGLRECNFLCAMPRLRHLELVLKTEGGKKGHLEEVGKWMGQLTELTYLRLGLMCVMADAAGEFAQHLTSLCSLNCLDLHLNLNEVFPDAKDAYNRAAEESKILFAVYSEVAGTSVPASDLLEATARVKSGAKGKERKKGGKRMQTQMHA